MWQTHRSPETLEIEWLWSSWHRLLKKSGWWKTFFPEAVESIRVSSVRRLGFHLEVSCYHGLPLMFSSYIILYLWYFCLWFQKWTKPSRYWGTPMGLWEAFDQIHPNPTSRTMISMMVQPLIMTHHPPNINHHYISIKWISKFRHTSTI